MADIVIDEAWLEAEEKSQQGAFDYAMANEIRRLWGVVVASDNRCGVALEQAEAAEAKLSVLTDAASNAAGVSADLTYANGAILAKNAAIARCLKLQMGDACRAEVERALAL